MLFLNEKINKSVDHTIIAVHKNKIDEFHEHYTGIQFTKEIEDGKIPFLECLVSRENNTLRTTVYKKPTHTYRLPDQTSYNPISHKASTVRAEARASRGGGGGEGAWSPEKF